MKQLNMEFKTALVFVTALFTTIKGQSCPPGVNGVYMASTGRCLITKMAPLNWKDAQARCKSEATNAGFAASKGSIVNVQNPEMQEQVRSLVVNYLQSKSQQTTVLMFWLGAFETSVAKGTEPSNSIPEWAWIKDCPSCSSITDFKAFGQGCYYLSNTGVDVTNDLPGSLTIPTCTSLCNNRGYAYALLRMGFKCYCSNTYSKELPRNDCSSLCGGDRKSNCGGPTADYVYYVKGTYNLWDANKPDKGGDVDNGYQYCGKISQAWNTWKLDDFPCAERLPSLCELPTPCQSGTNYLSSSGRCYMLDGAQRNWWEARINCKNRGGDLAVLDSEAIHNATRDFMVGLTGYSDAWVGLAAKQFYWSDGQDLLFNNFTQYHPNKKDEECIGMNADEYRTSDIGSWSDAKCADLNPYICEIVINPPTTTVGQTLEVTTAGVTTAGVTTSKTSNANSVTSAPNTNNGGSNSNGGSTSGGSNSQTPAPSTGSQTLAPTTAGSNNGGGASNTQTTLGGGSNTGGGGSNTGGGSNLSTPAPNSSGSNTGGSSGSNTGDGSNSGSNTVTSSPTKNTNSGNNQGNEPATAAGATTVANNGVTTAGTTSNNGNNNSGNNNSGNNNGGNNNGGGGTSIGGNNGATTAGNGATTAANNNGNNNNGNNNSGTNNGAPASGETKSGGSDGLGTFEIVIIVVICLLLLAILIAIILFVKYKKNNGNNARVQPQKSYDARGSAPQPDSDEIYIPPSASGSTTHLIRP